MASRYETEQWRICTLPTDPLNIELEKSRPVGTRWSGMVNRLGWPVGMRPSNGEYVHHRPIHRTLNWRCVGRSVLDGAAWLMDLDGRSVRDRAMVNTYITGRSIEH